MKKIAIWCLAAFLSSSAAAVPAPSAPAPAASAESVLRELEMLTAAFEALTKKGLKHWTPRPAQDSEELKGLEKERTGYMERCLAKGLDLGGLLAGGGKTMMTEANNYLACQALAKKEADGQSCAAFLSAPKSKSLEGKEETNLALLDSNCRGLYRTLAWTAAVVSGSADAGVWCERNRPAHVKADDWKGVCRQFAAKAPTAEICRTAGPLKVSPEESEAVAECPGWVALIRGAARDCSTALPAERELCAFGPSYARAFKAGDAKLCGGNLFCRAAMGGGAKACSDYVAAFRAKLNTEPCAGELKVLEERIKSLRFQNATLVAAADQKTAADEFKDEISETLRLTRGAAMSQDLQARAEELSRITLNKPNPPSRQGIIMNLVILRDNLLQQRFTEIEKGLTFGPDPSRIQKVITALRKRKQEAAKAFETATSPKPAPKGATKKE